MAYSVDWVAKIVSVPTSDLTLVSGTRYSLTMSDFLAEIRRLEWTASEGLWAPQILDHSNTRFDFAGTDYAPFDDIINGYVIEFTGVATRVDLIGSNNNIIDVLVDNGVSVVPSNSAGLTSPGFTDADALRLAETWTRLGLNPADPFTDTPSQMSSNSGDIVVDLTGDGVNTTTQTRQ